MTHPAVASAQGLWQEQKSIDEDRCRLARQWVDFLEESGPRLAERLPGLAGIVAGTLASWNHEGPAFPGSFRSSGAEGSGPDSGAGAVAAGGLAHRCVLVAGTIFTQGEAQALVRSPLSPFPAALAAVA